MSQLTLEAPMVQEHPAGPAAPGGGMQLDGGSSLDRALSGIWEGLAAARTVACPVCGGDMAPTYGVHARPIGGRCRDCLTELT